MILLSVHHDSPLRRRRRILPPAPAAAVLGPQHREHHHPDEDEERPGGEEEEVVAGGDPDAGEGVAVPPPGFAEAAAGAPAQAGPLQGGAALGEAEPRVLGSNKENSRIKDRNGSL